MGYSAKTSLVGTSEKTPLKNRGRNDIQVERRNAQKMNNKGKEAFIWQQNYL